MSGSHTFLPSLDKIKDEINKNGLEITIKKYLSYDYLIGSKECMDFLIEKSREIKKGKQDENAI